jgi:hypothetical protein
MKEIAIKVYRVLKYVVMAVIMTTLFFTVIPIALTVMAFRHKTPTRGEPDEEFQD